MNKKPSISGATQIAVLGCVSSLKGNAYGKTIRKQASLLLDKDIAIGNIYNTLDRLESWGLVESELVEPTPETGGRIKKYYNITGIGELALEEAVSRCNRIASFLPSFIS